MATTKYMNGDKTVIDKYELLKSTLQSYLNWAKRTPACAHDFYAMAMGYAGGAKMALLYAGKNEEYEDLRNLWEELESAFKELL